MTFNIDKTNLNNQLKQIQRVFHPDKRFAETTITLEECNKFISEVNNVYQTLIDDVSRAVYIVFSKVKTKRSRR